MTMVDFTGGLNIKLGPNLIAQNESVICNNVDLSAGRIKPLKDLVATAQTIPLGNDKFTRFKGNYFSGNLSTGFVEFGGALYKSDSSSVISKTTDGITFYELGLDKPTTKPNTSTSFNISFTLSNISGGDLTSSTYTYLIAYKTDAESIRYEVQTFSTSSTGVRLTISSMANMEYVRLYRMYETKYRYIGESTSGLTIDDLVLDISGKTSTTPYEQALGTRNYVYTYYSSASMIESAPSPASDDLTVDINNVTVSGILPSSDPSVDAINIYRLGGTLTNYYLVAAVSKTTTSYVDTKSDLQVLDNDTLLETENLVKPPTGLLNLTEFNSAIFGSIGSKLYFSNSGLVDNWNADNWINFPEDISGLGATQNGLLVFARNKTWILTGTDLSNYSKYLLSGNQGCIAHNTIKYIENKLLWLSLDGICISNGGNVEIFSYKKLGKLNIEPIISEVYENQYYLFHTTGTLVIDFRDGVRFYTLSLIARGAYYNYTFDKLYILKPSNLGIYEYNQGNKLEFNYKTGWIAENGVTNYKVYKNIYIYSVGVGVVKLYLGDVLVNTLDLVDGFNDIKLPQANTKGYFIALEFTGTNEVVEINMVAEGRQNGR